MNSLRWPLRIAEKRVAGVTVLTLTGRMAQESAAGLSAAVGETVARGETRLVLDLEGVDYISSAGLMALEAATTRVKDAGGTLILTNIDGPLRTTLELAALLDRFDVAASNDEAINRLGDT